jgi:putative heme-binding domain-containing protein
VRRNVFIFLTGSIAVGGILSTLEPVFAQAPDLDAYARFALTREGNAAAGGKMFADQQKLACSKCHTVDGKGGKAGPDLFAIGDKFARRDLIEAVLRPSATIAVGYTTTIVTTKAGVEYTGIIKEANDAGIKLMGADGKLVAIAANEIKEQHGSATSLMPEGLHAGLSTKEFTDLVDYLANLKQPENSLVADRGMPAVIPTIAHPVVATPLFKENLTLPRGAAPTGLTAFYQVPGLTNVFLVLHQKGMIWLVEKSAAGEDKTDFLDVTGEVFSDRGPNGLLGLAFHPKFRENRKYYVHYEIFEAGKVVTILWEREFAPDFRHDSGRPARQLLRMTSVAEDHAGGCLQFGPDGYLYLAMGDTGPQQDPEGHGQNTAILLGKMLRLDVDHADGGNQYAIPSDNPFRDRPNFRPEIWAYGFREPWRFSFDPATGDLWLADVGQDRVEEVDIVRRGGNYGWNVFEAFEPFSNQYRKSGENYIPPLFAYRRKYGASVTGGFVYRADRSSSFYGVYICGDYVSKRIFGVAQEGGVLKSARVLGSIPQGLVSFGIDEAGNLYAVGYEGMVYKLDFSGSRYNETSPE